MSPEQLDGFFSDAKQRQYVLRLMRCVGITRRRAECFVRLWVYLWLKQQLEPRPLEDLSLPEGWVECTCREAARVFYAGKERGSDRSAGMMLDKLEALGLIEKFFDGNSTQIKLRSLPPLWEQSSPPPATEVEIDDFDPRCDAIPVANFLATNYTWMNRNAEAVPYRIANLLRDWAERYGIGMRVLRRRSDGVPVGFYALYPTHRDAEIHFFDSPSKGLVLSTSIEVDPFRMAIPGDTSCRALFIRSWMVDPLYQHSAQLSFLQDAQQTLQKMLQDFPNLCDMHTLAIHPSYEKLARALGFQFMNCDRKLSIYWLYQALDRFLDLDLVQATYQLQDEE